MIDRTIAPAIAPLSNPKLLQHQVRILDNGITLFITGDPSQEAFKMDILFKAGIVYQPKACLATTAINMLGEGTKERTSEEISELFDYYGAYIDANVGYINSELSLLGMNKYAEPLVQLVAEMITESVFPEKELGIFLKNRKQDFLVNSAKTSYIARKRFMKERFGSGHPYANEIAASDFDHISREDVMAFYQERYCAENCRIYLSGNIDGHFLQTVVNAFEAVPKAGRLTELPIPGFPDFQPGRFHVEKEDAVQNSIVMGKCGVQVTDPIYPEFLLANTIFGGYFSSRLVRNIREEKGYTYGISSYNLPLSGTASWFIASDINAEVTEKTIEECVKEMKNMAEEPVPLEEFNRARQYLHGELLRELDGVFAQSDMLKHKMSFGTDLNLYNRIINSIKTATPESIQELASRFFKPEECIIVTAGK